jgi:hypothetical protein
MRPCRQCRTPIENSVTTCPQCGTTQADAPKPTAPKPQRRFFRRKPAAATDSPEPVARRGVLPETAAGALMVVAGVLVGFVFGGWQGAVLGGILAFVLILLFVAGPYLGG